MGNPSAKENGFDKIKSLFVGITGVFLVVPALINAGVDIYSSLAKVPKTEAEKINVELFKKYFNKPPVTAIPLPIKQHNGTVTVHFSVYEEGDIYVEYGLHSQWFPFPKNTASVEGPDIQFNMFSKAYADDSVESLQGFGKYQQNDSFVGNQLLRERIWENGVKENLIIDPRTGQILSTKRELLDGENQVSLSGTNTDQYRADSVPPLDLEMQMLGQPVWPNSGFPTGWMMQACGCWGPNPSLIAPEPRCSSGSVTINICPGFCAPEHPIYSYVCQ